jgi:hypothetical protein
VSFFVVVDASVFLVVDASVDDFLVVDASVFLVVDASVDDFFMVDDFLVDVLAGAFSGAVVVVVVADSFLVVHEAMRPAATKTLME